MNSRPVLLIALPSLAMGGAEQFLTSLANEISDRFEVHFYIFSKKLTLKDNLVDAKIHAFSNPIKGIVALHKTLKTIRPDVVLTSIVDLNLIIVFFSFLFPSKTKVVIREAADTESSLRLSRYPRITKILYRKLYPKADHIICLSKGMREKMLKILEPCTGNISVISNGVSNHRMGHLPISLQQDKMVLAVGRLNHEKGFDKLVKAFYQFVKTDEGKGYHLLIVGDGPLRDELQMDINALGLESCIHLKGEVRDPMPFYIQARFLVLPSRFEGVSNVMLEALVNGVPVLATKSKTSAEYYIDESNGVLVDCCDDLEIFSGLQMIEANLGRYDRNAIAEKWRSVIGLDVIADKYVDILEEIAATADEIY